jgi:ribosomal protein S18 acetylase RimI-like enzyme
VVAGREVTFREIVYGTPEYRLECRLREEVLREPLGLRLRDEDVADEENQLHFGLFGQNDEPLACAVAVRLSPTKARIRQMAVSPAHQRKGLGRQLMRELEKDLHARGFRNFELRARTTAVGFYERLGYRVAGAEFIDVTIPHVWMTKVA